MLIDMLKESTLFRELSATDLEQISRFCDYIELDDGQMLLNEHAAANNDLFVLLTGTLEILSSSNGDLSGEVAISMHEKDIFGEIAWLTGQKRTASVRTHGSAEVVRINGESLTKYIEDNPKTGCKILRSVSLILAERIKHSNTLVKQILWNHHL